MKQFMGWMMVVILLAMSFFLFTRTSAEVSNVRSVQAVLQENIDVDELYLSSNSIITDANGRVIADVYGDTNRIYLPFNQIPQLAVDAFVATEDRRFYEHQGFDATGIARALLTNTQEGGIEQGASTITQQMVRNIYLDHTQTYERKLSELLYAYELEKQYSKDSILELYLNSIYFGNQAYGLQTASHLYFSKPAELLTLAEVAFLTAIPNNPTYYDPLQHPERTNERKGWVLTKMEEAGAISSIEHEEALEQEVTLEPENRTDLFPDYTSYVLQSEFKQLVSQKEGYSKRLASANSEDEQKAIQEELDVRVDQLLGMGLTIHTALEPIKQNEVVSSLSSRLPEEVQGGAVVIDHDRHAIVAMGGGRDFKKGEFNRSYQSYRHPGSALKPLVDFAPYLNETGAATSMTLNGNPVNPSCDEEEPDCVRNFNDALPGTVSLMEAFKQSYNVPAQELLDRIGVETGVSYLDAFHFRTLHDEERSLALALGAIDISVLELTRAYTTFAHDGMYTPAYAITEVLDEHGETLYSWDREETEVWSKETNEKMRAMLSEVITSGTAASLTMSQDGYSGGKTGTSQAFRDLWFAGLTDQYTASVWVGYDTPKSMETLSREQPALKTWGQIMDD
ncbi:transglycosylase domain-containing protein [Shouchella shacheensis]|uniref:transglycosylase domain-containing protein n=1 Tax=Shouchella shacheensis TaxID=1649580 RepID=UPI0012F9DDDC|nr:transglycosylase domain-containing protein [Shouchella shacheensis]